MSQTTSTEETIRAKLTDAFQPIELRVVNESHLHAGHQHHDSDHHAAFDGTGETHFRVIIVSETFQDMSRIARHRAVNDALKAELAGGVHALAVEPSAPGEPGRRSRQSRRQDG